MTDYLESLPTDEYPMDATESHLFNDLIKVESGGYFKLFHELRYAFIAGVLFFILNMDMVDSVLQSTIPYAKSSTTSLLFCKSALFMIAIFLLQNYHLVTG